MDRTPRDRTLRRWLATGRPRRIRRLITSSPDVARRLDELSKLDAEHAAALHDLATVPEEFGPRAVAGVQRRREEYTSASLVVDLLGLGLHVGRVVLEPDDDSDHRTDDH